MRRLCPLARGTTSACAENTGSLQGFTCYTWNYLRVRGEYWRFCNHTRGGGGTTSACAENTSAGIHTPGSHGNYLRVRGEYMYACAFVLIMKELPPRARRIPRNRSTMNRHDGTTSACAENTGQSVSGVEERWNYLRVRGEYGVSPERFTPMGELPPRARRIPHRGFTRGFNRGTTSACAENTHRSWRVAPA